MLERKFLGDWENLDFMRVFWNPIWDQRDVVQYRRLAQAWRLRHQGSSFNDISKELAVDTGKACALVSGKNLRPYLAQMYLNCQMLSELRHGWKWTLQTTPKPTNPYPMSIAVPEKIQEYSDITDFLAQFPPLPEDNHSLRFFGLTSEWVEHNKPNVFAFLMGFLVGDAGKYYSDYAIGRHYSKTGLRTNMCFNESNNLIMRYVGIPLTMLGLWTHPIVPTTDTLRWTSEHSDIITWILRTCIGLKPKQRTSRNQLKMDWLYHCPRDFLASFVQGIAESDGNVSKSGYYVCIASKPNSNFICQLLNSIGINARVHPKHKPYQVRTTLTEATKLPFFSPIIRSYRQQQLMAHAENRRILPPSPSFSMRNVGSATGCYHMSPRSKRRSTSGHILLGRFPPPTTFLFRRTTTIAIPKETGDNSPPADLAEIKIMGDKWWTSLNQSVSITRKHHVCEGPISS